jgi:Predicted nucleic acid-binding protein, contains PIN domain
MLYYFDTDAVVKYLTDERGHEKAVELFNNPGHDITIGTFSIPEVVSAITLKLNSKEIRKRSYDQILGYFFNLIDNSTRNNITLLPIANDHIKESARLIRTYSLKPGDALHLAMALEYKEFDVIMVTGDGRIITAARKEGLSNININECICTSCGHVYSFSLKNKICPWCKHQNSIVDKAKCLNCGAECKICVSPQICERVRKQQAVIKKSSFFRLQKILPTVNSK